MNKIHAKYSFDDLQRFFLINHSSDTAHNYTLFVEVPKINQVQAIAMMPYSVDKEPKIDENNLEQDIKNKKTKGIYFSRVAGYRTSLKALPKKYIFHPIVQEITKEAARIYYPDIVKIEIVNGMSSFGKSKEYTIVGDKLWK